jgi:hypothetical protein
MTRSVEVALAASLARAGDPSAVPALRELVGHDAVEVRLLAQIGLARAGDDDPATVETRLGVEGDLGVYTVLAARAGRLAIGAQALTYLAAQAAYDGTPAVLRAACAWAIAQHDADRAARLPPGSIARVAALLGW